MTQNATPQRRLPLASRSSLGNGQNANHSSPVSPPIGTARDLLRKAPLNAPSAHGSLQLPFSSRQLQERDAKATSSSPNSALSHDMDTNQELGIEVNDIVQVPGGMLGVVKYIGSVKGKAGVFAGVELNKEFAGRGKNDGDVDGVRYFTTSVPGAGIFLPAHRATKQGSSILSAESFPLTPTTPSFTTLDSNKHINGNGQTPPPPSNFKPGAAAGTKSALHTLRKTPNFSQSVGPGARAPSPQLLKPKSRPSLPRPESPMRRPPNLQPTPAAFSQSMRGGRPPALSGTPAAKFNSNKIQTPASLRSPSRSQSRCQSRSQSRMEDNDLTPTGVLRTTTNGIRPQLGTRVDTGSLQKKLGERDKQLKEQAANLAQMESSLTELQTIVASQRSTGAGDYATSAAADDAAQLRMVIREKNEKIAMLTAEFDAHRADFRSTIDTLEMASTETERVYEKRVEELLREREQIDKDLEMLHKENAELRERAEDVETVTAQFKMLEELVQELEEGLEDARRGEAEARTEVEFLRGEVERGRSELKREREKSARPQGSPSANSSDEALSPKVSKEVEQRDDEIRGLKAIIHSLSSGPEARSPRMELENKVEDEEKQEVARLREEMEAMRRNANELCDVLKSKTLQVEDLEQKLQQSSQFNHVPNYNEEQDEITAHYRHSVNSAKTAIPNHTYAYESPGNFPAPPNTNTNDHKFRHRAPAVTTTDDGCTTSETSTDTLWCEICEKAGHDVLTCSSVFATAGENEERTVIVSPPVTSAYASMQSKELAKPETPAKEHSRQSLGVNPGTAIKQAPQDGGPAPGKSSGVVDMSKWCALCECDGHESVDCPFEEDF